MSKNKYGQILDKVESYYTGKLLDHGPTAGGVDWNSRESQELRFDQLLKVCDTSKRFSVIDYGCGYGRLSGYMLEKGLDFSYLGIDLSEEMISKAIELSGTGESVDFKVEAGPGKSADYAIASGVFNVKFDSPEPLWKDYVLETLDALNAMSDKGFAFNSLTSYSDKELMRDDLYYADPCMLFDYCKRNFSKDVALLHDYGLYEFTMIVRK